MAKKKIYRSGVIPYHIVDGEIRMLFMKPSEPKFGGDVFQIAKGKREEGESPLETGLREANEELGLFSGNIKETHELGEFMGRTTIFVCEIKDPDAFGDPHFETKEVKWMTPEEFQKEGRDLHKPVVKAAVRWIKNQQEKQLDEIQLIHNDLEKGFSWNQIDIESGQMQTLSSEPYEVWKYETTDPKQVMFVLRDPKKNIKDSAASVIGQFDSDNNYFIIQRAWTHPNKRKQGFMTQLYVTLNTRLQMSLASDMQHSAAMAKVWKALPLKQTVYDLETGESFDRNKIPDEELYNQNNPNKYRLLIEKSNRYNFEYDNIKDFDPASSILFEFTLYTHPSNRGKYL